MADKWEVVRIFGDERQHVRSTHKSPELAERAYAVAAADPAFYAVDVSYLPGGRVLDFEPAYGTANGLYWVAHEGRPVYSEAWVNALVAQPLQGEAHDVPS